MDWNSFIFLLLVTAVAYLPYKLVQKKKPDGLAGINFAVSFGISTWMIMSSLILLDRVNNYPLAIHPVSALVFVALTLLWLVIPSVIPKIGRYPAKMITENKKLYVVRLIPHSFYLKYIEVMFQQIKFLFLIHVVLKEMHIISRITWFTVIVVLIHLGNLFFLRKKEALYFSALSFPMAIVFGWLLVKGNLLLTLSVHLAFYIYYACAPWFTGRANKNTANGPDASKQMGRPKVLYHASMNKNLKVIKPRALRTRDKSEGPVIFATPIKAIASIFLVPTNDTWTRSGLFGDVVYFICGDKQRFAKLDKGGAIYTIPSKNFGTNPNKGLGSKEWTGKQPVVPLRKEIFRSGENAMLSMGVQVFFVDKSTFKAIAISKDHGNKIIRSAVSQNRKLNINPKTIPVITDK